MSVLDKKRKLKGLHIDVNSMEPVFVKVGDMTLTITCLGKNGTDVYSLNFSGPKDFQVYREVNKYKSYNQVKESI